jgi:molybdopterin synthase sulfur carrier subunit
MIVLVRVPAPLRQFSDGRSKVSLDVPDVGAATVAAVLARLRAVYPGVYERALDERGHIRQHMNVFLNTENVKESGGLHTPVSDGDEVWIIPAVSGG